ncbi:hypothetical protein EDL98_05205 [Ornithobacterium rhinotracheale]|uniref:hypothetical protein n=1 Tax=Ornithobacterium rhinotracheale TaxID=28251 RepID=UPI00129C279A|nr:hypothetical protein [Ornithobacterium rhinotracheale]MRJ10477.1 hypothetical protein [Ornithobacterium rhinotracheale]
MREISILKERILQYLDFKGVKKSKFYEETGVSNGVLSQKNGLSEDNLMRFLNFYSDINPKWLLTGEGEMLKTPAKQEEPVQQVAEPHATYNNTAHLEEKIAFLQEKIQLLQENKALLEDKVKSLEGKRAPASKN